MQEIFEEARRLLIFSPSCNEFESDLLRTWLDCLKRGKIKSKPIYATFIVDGVVRGNPRRERIRGAKVDAPSFD